MEEFRKAEHLVEHLKEYVNTRISLAKLEIAEKVSRLIAWAVAALFVFIVLLIFIVFLGLSAAHGIGDALGKPYLGFLIVAGFYLFVAFLVWWQKEKLLRMPLMNAIVRQLFPVEDKNADENI